jgi:hypothetical protein
MTQPTAKAVDAALKDIEAIERDPSHPRSLARAVVKRWRSDAQKLKLGVSNQHDSGAPSLRVDDVLRGDDHNRRLGRK